MNNVFLNMHNVWPDNNEHDSCLARFTSLKLLLQYPDPSGRDYFFLIATEHLPLWVGTSREHWQYIHDRLQR